MILVKSHKWVMPGKLPIFQLHSFSFTFCLLCGESSVFSSSPKTISAPGLMVQFMKLPWVFISDKISILTLHRHQLEIWAPEERGGYSICNGDFGTRGVFVQLLWSCVVACVFITEKMSPLKGTLKSFCKCNGSSWIKWERQCLESGE